MSKNLKINKCLLISLGAYGKNKLITNGQEIKEKLKIYYQNVEVLSSDKFISLPRYKRLVLYFRETIKFIFSFENTDIFIHMNTLMALPILLSPFRKNNKVITWYSHKKISLFTRKVLKKSDVILTGSPEIKNLYPKSIFTHAIVLPSLKDIKRCNLRKNSRRELVFLGRFSKIKRLDLFLEIAEKAAKLDLIDGVRIMAASHESAVEEMVFERLKLFKIETKIYKDSLNKNIYTFFKPGDIYLNMQSKCGIGKAMLEACAIGIEVIVACKELQSIIGTIDRRTIKGLKPVPEAIDIIKEIVHLDIKKSREESNHRILMTSKLNVSKLIDTALKIAY